MSMFITCQARDCFAEAVASAQLGRDPRYFPHLVSGATVWVCADHFPNGKSGNPIVDDLRERIETVGKQRDAAEARAAEAEASGKGYDAAWQQVIDRMNREAIRLIETCQKMNARRAEEKIRADKAEARAQAAETRAVNAERDRESWRTAAHSAAEGRTILSQALCQAEARAERLAAALGFYANPRSWLPCTVHSVGLVTEVTATGTQADWDKGKKARKALAADTPTQEGT